MLNVYSNTIMLLVMAQTMASQAIFTRNSEIPFRVNRMVKLQQVKERILRGLNMTSAPVIRTLEPGTSEVKARRPEVLERMAAQENISIMFSESYGQRADTMSFKMDTRLRDRPQDIEVALLVVFLHTWNNTSHKPRGTSHKPRGTSHKLQGTRHKLQGTRHMPHAPSTITASNSRSLPNHDPQQHHDNETSAQSDHRSGLKSAMGGSSSSPSSLGRDTRPRRGPSQPGRERTQGITLVLKVLDQDTGYKRRIAEEGIQVDGSTIAAVPVPKHVLVNAATSPGHTLVLQISCNKCKGRVQMERVYKTFRDTKRKTRRRLNPNRPYIFVKTGSLKERAYLDRPMRAEEEDQPNQVGHSGQKRQPSIIRSNMVEHTFAHFSKKLPHL